MIFSPPAVILLFGGIFDINAFASKSNFGHSHPNFNFSFLPKTGMIKMKIVYPKGEI